MAYPAITADLAKLRENLDNIAQLCHESGMTAAAVTKCVCADERIVSVINESKMDMLADSRVQNLETIRTNKPKMLIRIAMPGEAERVVACADISMQSEPYTIGLVGAEAKRQGRVHKILLMADFGDLREGIFFKNETDIYKAAEAVLSESCLELYGLGMNLSCYGGIMPSDENLGGLADMAERLRKRYGITLPMVSGGNSSTITKLLEHSVPKGITHMRMGECWLLGNDTNASRLIPGHYGDAFTLTAQLVEVQRKPSKPIGITGKNAFGEEVNIPDRGEMVRGILAIGRQDINAEALVPRDSRVEVLGGSSDHTIVNLTDAGGDYRVGDLISFDVDYGALLKAYTSKYVEKRYS